MSKNKKAPVPKEHWEMPYKPWEPSANMKATGGADFCPKQPSLRKTTHLKVNKEDH